MANRIPRDAAIDAAITLIKTNLPPGTNIFRSGYAFAENIKDAHLPAVVLVELQDEVTTNQGGFARGASVKANYLALCHGMAKAPKASDIAHNYSSARHELAYGFIEAALKTGDIQIPHPTNSSAPAIGTAQFVHPFKVSYSMPRELDPNKDYPYFLAAVSLTLQMTWTVQTPVTYENLVLTINDENLETGTEDPS